MSPSAWGMLVVTWSVVIGVSGYLFWKVVRRPRPPGGDRDDRGRPGPGA